MQHVEDAIKKIHPLSSREIEWYKRIEEKFGKQKLSDIGMTAIT